MKSNFFKITTVILVLALAIFGGCNMQKTSDSNKYDDKINSIYQCLKEYKSSGEIDQFNPNSTISYIEDTVGCNLVKTEGYGVSIYVFDVDEHLSFSIVDIPYTVCVFMIDGETYTSYYL